MDNSRYTCQVHLPGFGANKQALLANARVLIAGMGGLGCPVAQYLAAAGVGTLGLADGDTVQERNLNRQVLYGPGDVGQRKTTIAGEKLRLQNPEVGIRELPFYIAEHNASEAIADYDLVVDCTDNFTARYLLNDVCVSQQKPLVYGAVYQYEGHVAVWNVPTPQGATASYRDAFPEANEAAIPNCSDGGVLPTLTGIIGTMQANEVLKYITGIGDVAVNKLLIVDALSLATRSFKVKAHTQPARNAHEPSRVVNISWETYSQAPDTFTLIDVRTEDERQQYHIGGLHHSMELLLQGIYPPLVSTQHKVLFYCATGKRSLAAAQLYSAKYNCAAFTLEGGLATMLRTTV
ncbi:MAG: thiamine biosynthesis protein [Chitinophagia bacterium]|nr:thiamine biosynthesis protein [Chitinophagia bacterium]